MTSFQIAKLESIFYIMEQIDSADGEGDYFSIHLFSDFSGSFNRGPNEKLFSFENLDECFDLLDQITWIGPLSGAIFWSEEKYQTYVKRNKFSELE